VFDTGHIITGVVVTGDKISPVFRIFIDSMTPVTTTLAGVKHLVAKISAKFRKNSKWPQVENLVAGSLYLRKKLPIQEGKVRVLQL
jgi:hypothetical protein